MQHAEFSGDRVPPPGGGFLTRLWIGVCSPGWHTLTLPRPKFPTLPRKKKGKITTLARISVSEFKLEDQNTYTPCQTVIGPENNTLPRQKP